MLEKMEAPGLEEIKNLPEGNMNQLIKPAVLEFLSKKGFWFRREFLNTVNNCQYCSKQFNGKEAELILLTEADEYFIPLHFRCAFKEGIAFETGLPYPFNYKYDFKTGRVW